MAAVLLLPCGGEQAAQPSTFPRMAQPILVFLQLLGNLQARHATLSQNHPWHHLHQVPLEGICLQRQGHRPGEGLSLCAGFKMMMGLSKSTPASQVFPSPSICPLSLANLQPSFHALTHSALPSQARRLSASQQLTTDLLTWVKCNTRIWGVSLQDPPSAARLACTGALLGWGSSPSTQAAFARRVTLTKGHHSYPWLPCSVCT